MGKITKIRGHYEKLSNQERLKLMANAVIRNDDDEIKALQGSTPKKSYLMPDAWLYDRYHALWRISVMYWLATEESLRNQETTALALTLTTIDAEEDPRETAPVKNLGQEIQAINRRMSSISEAIKRLAGKVGLSPDELLAYAPPEVRERMALSGPLDSKMVDQYYSLFAEYWPGLEGNDRECA